MRNVLSILLVFCVAIAVQCESIKSKIESPDCGSNGKLCPEEDGNTCCPIGDDGTEPTCCKSASSSTGWGCCSITNAVCCDNGLRCCYPGFKCTDEGKCIVEKPSDQNTTLKDGKPILPPPYYILP